MTTEVEQAMAQTRARTLWRFCDLRALGYVEDRSTLRRWMKSGVDPFPEPILLTRNTLAWHADEVRAWIERRPRGLAHDRRPGVAEHAQAEGVA
jgi:predicted DNA-binding transcriptional regulator AlpA